MEAPYDNGVMDLTVSDENTVLSKLNEIKNAFAPTEEEPELTTHILVSRYNKQNPTAPINGDTAEFLVR